MAFQLDPNKNGHPNIMLDGEWLIWWFIVLGFLYIFKKDIYMRNKMGNIFVETDLCKFPILYKK